MHTNGKNWYARDYVDAVARSVHGETVRWPSNASMDAVIVLPVYARNYPGLNAVLLWNRNFGWSWGIEERDFCRTISVVRPLGIGRVPEPGRCADRVIDLISAGPTCTGMCNQQ